MKKRKGKYRVSGHIQKLYAWMVESVLIEAHAINVRGIPGTSYKSKLSEKKFDRLLDKQRKKMEKEKQKVYKLD